MGLLERRYLLWLSPHVSYKLERVRGLTGLTNFANNCYMNAIIQCLSHTEPLARELLQLKAKSRRSRGGKGPASVALELSRALRSLWAADPPAKPASVKPLKELMAGLKGVFRGSRHHDSTEFLLILLELLHDDLSHSQESGLLPVLDGGDEAWAGFQKSNSSLIQRLFCGQQRSSMRCLACGHTSLTYDTFFSLFVPIPGAVEAGEAVSLESCLELYTSEEGVSGWVCPGCGGPRAATKRLQLTRLPPVLVLALKRFTAAAGLNKKDTLVRYPLTALDMAPYLAPSTPSTPSCSKYDLHAISTHVGSLGSGHHRALCRHHLTSRWYLFDDALVQPVPVPSAQHHPDVYILFYHAV